MQMGVTIWLSTYQLPNSIKQNTPWFSEGGNVTICILFGVNSITDGNFFHTILWFSCQSRFSFLLISTNDADTWYDQHANAFLSLSILSCSLWNSIRRSDPTAAPCINNRMNTTVLSVHRVTLKLQGREEMLQFFCAWDTNYQYRSSDIGIERLKPFCRACVASNMITRESQPSAVFPCFVVVNLSGIHSNSTEFSASN